MTAVLAIFIDVDWPVYAFPIEMKDRRSKAFDNPRRQKMRRSARA